MVKILGAGWDQFSGSVSVLAGSVFGCCLRGDVGTHLRWCFCRSCSLTNTLQECRKDAPKMGATWPESPSKSSRGSTKSCQKVARRLPEGRTKVSPRVPGRCSKGGGNIGPESPRIRPKSCPRSSQGLPKSAGKMLQRWGQLRPRVTPNSSEELPEGRPKVSRRVPE